jgi:hypothetical protein
MKPVNLSGKNEGIYAIKINEPQTNKQTNKQTMRTKISGTYIEA